MFVLRIYTVYGGHLTRYYSSYSKAVETLNRYKDGWEFFQCAVITVE